LSVLRHSPGLRCLRFLVTFLVALGITAPAPAWAQKKKTDAGPPTDLPGHIDYVAKLVGADYVGLGSDFDGISAPPMGLDDVTYLPTIARELQRRGYSDDDIRKVLGGNFMRVFAAACK